MLLTEGLLWNIQDYKALFWCRTTSQYLGKSAIPNRNVWKLDSTLHWRDWNRPATRPLTPISMEGTMVRLQPCQWHHPPPRRTQQACNCASDAALQPGLVTGNKPATRRTTKTVHTRYRWKLAKLKRPKYKPQKKMTKQKKPKCHFRPPTLPEQVQETDTQ